jgi:TPR repeat protein
MVAPLMLLCLALLLPATVSRAADATNAPASSQKSPAAIEGAPAPVEKALAQDNSDALVDLGLKYANGDGVPQDGKKAVGLFISAVTLGNAHAEHNLGAAYLHGVGVTQDNAKAVDWLKAAARDGDAEARFDLGRMYSTKFDGPPDLAKAFAWTAASATQAYPPAETKLGELYEEGAGVERDMVESLKWLQLAVDAGNKDALPRRNEVAALLDPAQKDEARRRAQSFKPGTNYVVAADDAASATCPLGNYFQIPVKIFGETNLLVVDTGSTGAFLGLRFQDRLGEPLTTLAGITTSSSTAIFGPRECPEIFIGQTRFAPLIAVVGDIQRMRQVVGEPIQGVLGLTCLKYEVICFDSDHGIFSIGGSVPAEVKKNALALPLVEKESFEFGINASINGQGPFFLTLDSGASESIYLNDSDWQKAFSGKHVKSHAGNSVDAEDKIGNDRSARLQSFTLGTNRYSNLIVDSLPNAKIYSRFGQKFIRRHLCYVDFPGRMLYLLPGRDFNRPEETDMSGLHILNVDGRITVYSADKDTPAYKAGIRSDDQILSINGQDVASLPLKSIRETLKSNPGDEIKMQIKHGTETKFVTFRLKRLL